MKKEVMSFRTGMDTRTYLLQLLSIEQERAEKFGVSPVDRSTLINDAIKNYYFTRMNARDSDPVTENVMKAVEQVSGRNASVLARSLNSTRYDILIIKEYVRLFCKAVNFDESKDGLDKLLNTEMSWDTAISEKVEREIGMMERQNG